jgi:hypothetical protein
MTGSAGWITMLPTRFAGSFTNCAGYVCPNIAGVQRHRRHLDGTPVTPDRPAIYATYAIYGPPMLKDGGQYPPGEGSRSIAQGLRTGPISVLKDSLFGHFFVGVPTRFLICRNSFVHLRF